jgi:branched-chain amino acid transport system permease protein
MVQQLIDGLTIGSVYALAAIGFSVVYGALRLVNFAHGDVLMAGAFVAYGLADAGVPIAVACLVAVAVGGLLALGVQQIAVRPIPGANPLIPMMTTLGMGLIIRNLVELRWGSGAAPFPSFAGSGFYVLGGLRIARAAVVTLSVAVGALLAFGAFLRRTKAGFAIRAVAQDMTAAHLMGIPVQRTIATVYLLGGALGVVGGLLLANTLQVVYEGMGFPILLKAFAAAVVGGIGNMQGALLGGVCLGVLEAVAGPALGSYRDALAFLLLIAVLLVKPTGVFGSRVQERV